MWPFRRLRRSIATHELLLEVLVRVILLLTVCILQLCVKPHKRYISEDDLILYYKRPRFPSIVPAWATVFIVICLPLICFAVPEYVASSHVDITHAFLAWTLALSINAFITEITKLITGRPRPDFFYRCYPEGKINKALMFIEDSKDIWEGRKSFPSGHSSFAFCSMGFVSVWLCGKLGVLSHRRGRAGCVLACLLPLALALGVGISRCCDNHHHWEDVLVGSLLGLVVSYMSYTQYFYALDSELSGTPLHINSNTCSCSGAISQGHRGSENCSYATSGTECSTKHLLE